MFQLLLTLLRILVPLDPVAQLREVTRFFITSLFEDLATPDRLAPSKPAPTAACASKARSPRPKTASSKPSTSEPARSQDFPMCSS